MVSNISVTPLGGMIFKVYLQEVKNTEKLITVRLIRRNECTAMTEKTYIQCTVPVNLRCTSHMFFADFLICNSQLRHLVVQ